MVKYCQLGIRRVPTSSRPEEQEIPLLLFMTAFMGTYPMLIFPSFLLKFFEEVALMLGIIGEFHALTKATMKNESVL